MIKSMSSANVPEKIGIGWMGKTPHAGEMSADVTLLRVTFFTLAFFFHGPITHR